MKKNGIIFGLFGLIYICIELLYRGYSHPSMFVLGGLCGLCIGLINEYTPKMNMILQMILGTVITISLEFIFGYILNVKLGLGIWDYSNMKYNLMGQICPQFTLCWFLLSYPCIKLDDILRNKFNC